MRSSCFILATIALGMLAGCSLDQLPLPSSVATEQPAATTAPARPRTPTPPRPATTAAPLPPVASVPTLAPDAIGPLETQQRALVELYRRVNPAVVSIDV